MNNRIEEVLSKCRYENQRFKYPHGLSGGKHQRVAIARLLLNNPELIFANAHGNLDSQTNIEAMEVLQDINKMETLFKEGEIYEDYSIVSPEDKEKHFGQIRSIEGLKQWLESTFFKALIKKFNKQTDDFFLGFKSPETVLIAIK